MKSIAALLLILLANNWIAAQESASTAWQPNTVFAGADGKFEAPPDTAIIQFNISAQEDTSRAAFGSDRVSAQPLPWAAPSASAGGPAGPACASSPHDKYERDRTDRRFRQEFSCDGSTAGTRTLLRYVVPLYVKVPEKRKHGS